MSDSRLKPDWVKKKGFFFVVLSVGNLKVAYLAKEKKLFFTPFLVLAF